MSCDEIKSRLGELADGELPAELRPALEEHLKACTTCRAEYEALRSMANALAQPPTDALPDGLWNAIEARLDAATPTTAPGARRRRAWVYQLAQRPLAAAAVLVLAIGFGWLAWDAPWASTAMAAEIDFRPLLEQANGDIEAGIHALIQSYGGKPISLQDAAKRMKIRVNAPDTLPNGMRLKARYLLNMGRHHQALAFHYTGPGGQLLLLQCPPMIKKDFGSNECMPCSIGAHGGCGVRVGKLYLMHMMSNNVCVCVVGTLDEHTELPAALDAVRIDF